ncbi:transport and Golgi organization protein 1 homolog isoform X3 [Etheostoma cragini]|uniref:transport and Golgi organization protein 1 homolog isoform X3 n=1 Tax=Etheostoma cragini TaxID=417921 RepID=UPI00155E3D8B|nr:transport and Golgi organization protein 1 homolog isoform X3 [Etheostoma cragini]
MSPQTMESMEGKEHQMLKSIANEGEDNNREPGEEESNPASGTDQDFFTQSDISLGPDVSIVDLNVNSSGQSVGDGEKDKPGDVVGVGPEIQNQIDNTEESTDTSVTGAGSDGHEGEGNNAETDVLHREVPKPQTDDSAEESRVSSGAGGSCGKSQPSFLSSGTAEERNEPTSNEDNTLPAHRVETNVDHSDSLAMIDDNTERETRQGELGEEGISQEFGSAHSTNRSTETMYGNGSEEDRRTFSTSESTGQMDNNEDQDSVSPDMQQGSTQSDGDAHELEETVEETETDGESNLRPVQTETTELQKDMLNESGLKPAIGPETEEVEESKEEEKLGGVEELKEEGTQQDVKETKEEEKLGGIEDVKKEEKQREVKETKKEGKQEVKEIKEDWKQEEIEELKEGEQQQGVKEMKEEGKKQEVEETKEWRKQEEIEKLKEEKKQEVKEIKEEGKQEEVDKLKEKKKQEKVEEIKEEDNQEEEEGEQGEEEELNEEGKKVEIKEGRKKEIEGLKEEEKIEELKEVERENKQEKKEGEEKQVQSHLEVLMENRIHSLSPTQKASESPESESSGKETHGENSPQMDEEKREGENKKQEEVKENQETENLEGERRTKGKEGSLNCSNKLCPHASEDNFVGVDSVNKSSSIGEGTKETGKQNPVTDNDLMLADRKGVSQMVPVDDTERDKDVRQEEEEKKDDDAKAEEGKEKQVEQKNNDVLHSVVSDQNSLPNQVLLSRTAENKDDDQLYSSEADNTELSDNNVIPQGDKTKSEDTETSSKGISTENETEQIHSDYMIDTVENTDREEREVNVKHDDVRVNQGRDVSTGGTVFKTEEGMENSVSSSDPVESQAVKSQQTAPRHPSGSSHMSDGHNKGAAETGSAGAFGLFKNAFSFFSQTPVTETKESPESAPILDSDKGETSKAQASLPPEPVQDSTTDSSQVHMQDLHTDSPITLSQQQLQPLFTETQTSSPAPTQTRSHPSESSIQKKTLTKHYKNLLTYMSAYETTIMMELFGRHKLQFLDYVLGSSETTTDDPDNDESILLDIERLLRYHRETLVAPSMRLTDAPQEDKEKTTTLIALQKLEMLLARVRETFNTAEASCVGESCSSHSKDKEMAIEEDPSVCLDNHTPRDKWMGLGEEKDGGLSGGPEKEKVTEDKTKEGKGKRSGGESVSPESCPPIQPGSPQSPEGVMNQIVDFVHQIAEDSTTHVCAVRELLIWLTEQVVSTLPDDIRPGPDLYGVPWEPVIITSVVGLVTMLLFTCRCYSSVKSRMYQGKERRMAEQVAQLLDEKCKVLETLSKCQQEYDDLESSLMDSGVLAQTQKTEHLEVKARQLEHAKRELDRDLEELKDQLDQQREHRIEQEKRIAVLEESMKTFEEETKDLQSQEEQAQTTLKVYNMNSDRLQRNLETAGEENTLLQESNAQLRQQVEGWAERVSELEAEMSRCEVAHGGMLQDVANKDERIMSLTDRLLSMKAWDSELEEEEDEEGEGKEASNGTAGRGKENGRGDILDTQGHLQKVQKLIYAAKLNADLKSVDEDKDRLFAKLNDEVKAKEDLQARIEELDNEKLSLQSDTEQYSDQVQRLQQKLQIMTEMYQENELKLHRLLTVEEKERMQKEDKLNKADKNITMAMEELSNYRQRAGEMEEELEKTKQSYQTQMSAHEKKAHNNWLAARAAERELADIRRENALFRQKLTDTQFKLDALDKDPYALDSLARPLPFRAERSPYGPSPLGRPASETRAFLSPPTLMDGPPARLSPRVSRGPVEPPGSHGEMERSGGPHSDSGSISPTWERDRRAPPPGAPGLSGYMFPEQGGPMYRRPPPGALGLLPPPGPLHPRGLPPLPHHPADMADGLYRENSHGPGEQEHRESGPGDRRTPPEMDPRMGGAPPPGPPMGPMDGPYPRRSPYGPPPPDFYPPRGPGGPAMMPMWAPPRPGMMFPPRFPPGGPPHPHFAPPMRPPLPDGHLHPSMGPPPPQQSLPSPPQSQSPEEHTPSSEDAI